MVPFPCCLRSHPPAFLSHHECRPVSLIVLIACRRGVVKWVNGGMTAGWAREADKHRACRRSAILPTSYTPVGLGRISNPSGRIENLSYGEAARLIKAASLRPIARLH